MRVTNLVSKTSRTFPADEEAKNAQLLIRAGYIHKEMAGVYSFLPLGFRVLEKIKNIVREEMNSVGGQEVMMSVLQPKDIWQKTDRWDDKKVDNWFKTKLVNGTEVGVGLTHEEPIIDSIGDFLKSYKDLPKIVYQIQNKFRNELRAKSGLFRGREFLMKDMYSFASSQEQHMEIYENIVKAYFKVYERLGLGEVTYRTYADGGIFTKRFSDEFQTISPIGEDTIYLDREKGIAINEEIMSDENLAKMGLDKQKLEKVKAVEVGNTFHLETKYTDALDVYFSDKNGNQQSIIMGCYGIGISRLMGVIAEHFSDDKGLNWPKNIAPYSVYLSFIGQDEELKKTAEDLYEKLTDQKIEVLFDDRDARPSEKLTDSELLGIPFRIIVNKGTLSDGVLEFKQRSKTDLEHLSFEEIINRLK